jgi:tRNA-specific 2-thiouridylase
MSKINHKKPRVVVAMSGGVDSSVAAALLKKNGYDIIGVFLKFWHDSKCKNAKENMCCSADAANDARQVAEKLAIPFYVLNASKEFKKEVVDYYINEYQSGRTPNPCVICNKFIKFGWLLKKAKELGANYLATGHYARIKCSLASSQKGVRSIEASSQSLDFQWRLRPTFCDSASSQFSLYKAKDVKKDQTYFLWQLNQDQLRHVLFPIGNYTKTQVRKLAVKFGLSTAEKKESQNVCFIPDGDNEKFLKSYINKLNKKGKIIDTGGNVLGTHRGLAYYTIGQRHGLIENSDIKIQKSRFFGEKNKSRIPPIYVVKLNIDNNLLIIGEKKELLSKVLFADNVNWISEPKLTKIKAKIRYGHKESDCCVANITKNKLKVEFMESQMSVTPGQSVVFYSKNELLGGAIIQNS